MNPADINREIAGLCHPDGLWLIVKRGLFYRPNGHGYTDRQSEAWKLPFEEAKKHEYPRGEEPVTIRKAGDPNYHASLDACAQFEATLTSPREQADYAARLQRAISGPGMRAYVGEFAIATATAPQRCEAFLRLHGKWRGE